MQARFVIQSDRGGPDNRWGWRVVTMSGRLCGWWANRRDAIAWCEANKSIEALGRAT